MMPENIREALALVNMSTDTLESCLTKPMSKDMKIALGIVLERLIRAKYFLTQ